MIKRGKGEKKYFFFLFHSILGFYIFLGKNWMKKSLSNIISRCLWTFWSFYEIFIFKLLFFFFFADKVKKKYANLGDSVLVVHLERSHKGLGISLAGHKDRNRMAVFVCGLNPNGTAFKTGGIQVGDEILEVCKFFFLFFFGGKTYYMM